MPKKMMRKMQRTRPPAHARRQPRSPLAQMASGSTRSVPPSAFDEVLALIDEARRRAYQAVNTELVGLYWEVGKHISKKIASAEWGDGVVDQLAVAIARTHPGMRGFTRPNLFRMRQFYEAYRDHEKVSALLRQVPWTHHLLILSLVRRPEEREFYTLSAIKDHWTSRELERQIRAHAFRRAVLKPARVSAALTQIHPAAVEDFKNAYSLEFLGLGADHSEADLHASR